MTISIAAETPLQEDVRVMIEELNAFMNPLTPSEFQFQMTAEQIAESATTLFVARDEAGRAVGMGALKVHDAGLGEVKRMYTRDRVRGMGVGRDLLRRVERLAHEKGLKELKLETGEAPGFEEAWRVYERGGYTVCGAFLDYPDSGWSRFYMKKLG
ncbi:MAG: GNAT family N-acetyltransferase [Nitratireductor sp.]|nr:GNAT family N-acetyltransferase [Nitratireductor sp.]